MTLRFECPTCNAVMNAPDHKAGLKVSCLHCGQRLQVPGSPPSTVLARPLPSSPPTPAPNPAPPPPQPPTPAKSGKPAAPHAATASTPLKPVVACPSCKTPLTLPAGGHGVFQCPRCKNRISVPGPRAPAAQDTGIPVPHPFGAAPPPHPAAPPPATRQPPQAPAVNLFSFVKSHLVNLLGVVKSRLPRPTPLRVIAAAVAAVIVLSCAAYLFTGSGPLAGPPATCKQVVEHLRGRGMKLLWAPCVRPEFKDRPAVYVAKGDNEDGTLGVVFVDNLDSLWIGHQHTAVIVQYATEAEAKEAAGSNPDATSWGRFLIAGDKEFVKEIQDYL